MGITVTVSTIIALLVKLYGMLRCAGTAELTTIY